MRYILEHDSYYNVIGVHKTGVQLSKWTKNSVGVTEINEQIFNTCTNDITAWVWDIENLRLVPKIKIETDKTQITTTEACIVTATITPAEGDALVDEEVIFTVDGTDYPVMTTNGQAQIEYSNENPGEHIIQVRSAIKYGQNSITVEVV